MKLNLDCIRDCLIAIESNISIDDTWEFEDIHISEFVELEDLKKYNAKDIIYAIYQLTDAGYIVAGDLHTVSRRTGCYIRTITYTGHEFLANIRNDTVWNDVKGVASKIGSKSVVAITQIAAGVVNEIIKSYLRANGTIV